VIPLVDLKAQYRSIKSEIDAAVERVLDSGQFVLGEEVAAFEREFAAFCGTSDAIAVNSGTSALHLALLAAGVGPGDEVITVPFTFVATVATIRYTNARPVFVDVDPEYYTMDPSRLEDAITSRTKAIVPVHLYGQPADMDPILEIARRHNLVMIEDAAQAHGADYHGRRCGSMSTLAAFSFYPTKNLGAYGEGGAVVSSDAAIAQRIRMLRDWGSPRRYEHTLKGFNYRMEALQGAILRVKMKHIDAWTERRRSRAAIYARALAGSPLQLPAERPGCRHVFHVYGVRTRERRAVQAALQEQGIHTGIHYPIPLHLQPAHADLGYKRGDFPVAETLAEETLSLPMFAELTDDQIGEVSAALRGLLQQV
jgi:dTDP-4-amino-4,6-dideoxygalactose transaminase